MTGRGFPWAVKLLRVVLKNVTLRHVLTLPHPADKVKEAWAPIVGVGADARDAFNASPEMAILALQIAERNTRAEAEIVNSVGDTHFHDRSDVHKSFIGVCVSNGGAHAFAFNPAGRRVSGTCHLPTLSSFFFTNLILPLFTSFFLLDNQQIGHVNLTSSSLIRAMSSPRRAKGGGVAYVQKRLLGVWQFKWDIPSTHAVWSVPRAYVRDRFVAARFDDGIIYFGQVSGVSEDGNKTYVVHWNDGKKMSLSVVDILAIWDDRNLVVF